MAAVQTYDQCIEKMSDPVIAAQLKPLQQSHADRAMRLRDEIVTRGGVPDDDSGMWGTFANLVESSARLFGEKSAVAALEEGESHGRKSYEAGMENLDNRTRNWVAKHLIPEQERTHTVVRAVKGSM